MNIECPPSFIKTGGHIHIFAALFQLRMLRQMADLSRKPAQKRDS
jgi:hypothetical protein